MKVLIATSRTQGERGGDFCRAVPGELVIDLGRCNDATKCECVVGRAFLGLGSGHFTTTAVVVDLPFLDRRTYVRLLADSVTLRGVSTALLVAVAEISLRAARNRPVGTVVERTRGKTRARAARSRAVR